MTRMFLFRIALVAIACAIFSGCDAKENSSPTPSARRASKPEKRTSESKDAMTSEQRPEIVIETSMGTIRAELFADKTPKTVENFLQYVDDEYFDGLVFHRVIDGFMVQGGGLDADLKPKPTKAPIKNEASADVPNKRGTLAMARTSEVNSATSQFFINLADNEFLNHRDETPAGFGYCAFGQVTDGMDVVDKIAKVETTTMPPHQDVPADPVVINSIRRAE